MPMKFQCMRIHSQKTPLATKPTAAVEILGGCPLVYLLTVKRRCHLKSAICGTSCPVAQRSVIVFAASFDGSKTIVNHWCALCSIMRRWA